MMGLLSKVIHKTLALLYAEEELQAYHRGRLVSSRVDRSHNCHSLCRSWKSEECTREHSNHNVHSRRTQQHLLTLHTFQS